MASRPKMPVPVAEVTPQELSDLIRQWSTDNGYEFEFALHASEFGKVVVRDPAGGFSTTTIPNPHHGRRLRRDQARYTVRDLNNSWRD